MIPFNHVRTIIFLFFKVFTYFSYGRCGASTYMHIINEGSKEDKHLVVSSIYLRRLKSDKTKTK
jgi:hypothetical protein